jgi:hypothetical protein
VPPAGSPTQGVSPQPVTAEQARVSQVKYDELQPQIADVKKRLSDFDSRINRMKNKNPRSRPGQGLGQEEKNELAKSVAQRQALVDEQSQLMEQMKEQELVLNAHKTQERGKQPAVKALQSAGISLNDYASSRRIIMDAKKQYPDMTKMPSDVREKVDAATKVLQAAKGN